MQNFPLGCSVCALLACCSFVISSNFTFSELNFDSDLNRYESAKKTEKYLLERMNSYFTGDEETGVIKPLDLDLQLADESVNNTYKIYSLNQPNPSSIWSLPIQILQIIFGKYLDTKDVLRLSYTCKFLFLLVQSVTELNLSSFSPYFVLPDPKLNIIFYYDIIKYLKVNNLNDKRIHDAFQLYQIQRLVSEDSKPALEVFEPVRDSLRAFLYEIVNGLNSHFPDENFSNKLDEFKKFLQTHGTKNNFPMTLGFIRNLPANNCWKKRFYDVARIVYASKDELKVKVSKTFEDRSHDLEDYEIDWWVMDSYLECLVSDPKFDSLGYSFDKSEAFQHLIYEGYFSSDLFQKLVLAGESFFDDSLLRDHPNIEFVLALAQLKKSTSGKAIYILTRSAIEPFKYEDYCSIHGDDYAFNAFCALLRFNGKYINLAHYNTLTQMIRHQIFDFTTIDAPNRTNLLKHLVGSPRFSDILKMFQYDRLSPINLVVSFSSGGQQYYDGQIDETLDECLVVFNEDLILYLRSISDDPLPLLLFPVDLLLDLKIVIQNANFNIDKKYYFDHDSERIRFLHYFINLDQLFEAVVEFKTIVGIIRDNKDRDYEDIMSCFVSDITKFDEPTPDTIQPISLKRYFEDVVFETVHFEDSTLRQTTRYVVKRIQTGQSSSVEYVLLIYGGDEMPIIHNDPQ